MRSSAATPVFQNWAWNRINLLSNRDLLRSPADEFISQVAFADSVSRGVFVCKANDGTQSLKIARFMNSQLVTERARNETRSIDSVAVSADGNSVAYSVTSIDGNTSIYMWELDSGEEPTLILDARVPLKALAITSGRIIGSFNGVLCVRIEKARHGKIRHANV